MWIGLISNMLQHIHGGSPKGKLPPAWLDGSPSEWFLTSGKYTLLEGFCALSVVFWAESLQGSHQVAR